jgi:hypothetical protein
LFQRPESVKLKEIAHWPQAWDTQYWEGRVVVQFEKDPCQGMAFRRADKLGDSITRVSQLFDRPRAHGLKPVLVDVISARLKPGPDTNLIANRTAAEARRH